MQPSGRKRRIITGCTGQRVTKFIGFDATETDRTYGDDGKDPLYDVRYPLQEWGLTREKCKRVIADAGLPVPVKSACYFCPASKPQEIIELDSSQLDLALIMEKVYRTGRHWRGDNAKTEGLAGRKTWRDILDSEGGAA